MFEKAMKKKMDKIYVIIILTTPSLYISTVGFDAHFGSRSTICNVNVMNRILTKSAAIRYFWNGILAAQFFFYFCFSNLF